MFQRIPNTGSDCWYALNLTTGTREWAFAWRLVSTAGSVLDFKVEFLSFFEPTGIVTLGIASVPQQLETLMICMPSEETSSHLGTEFSSSEDEGICFFITRVPVNSLSARVLDANKTS